ncbi:MAG: hypothetical protein PHN93_00455 [Sphaerochaetaceae bacterium]|nr:hypothetical protein [Sphaerochaetaceae bacterium]
MLVPVFVRKLRRYPFKLVGKVGSKGNVIPLFQSGGHGVGMLRAQFPQVDAAGIIPAARVGNVKHIPQTRRFAAGVDERDAPAAAPDIPAHAVIPEIVFRAGGGVGALGVDHELLMVGVFI